MKNVLLVDDEVELLELYAMALEKCGFGVIPVTNALDGLAALKNKPIDVVITDISMPGMSGVEFIEKIHEYKYEVPIVVLSGHYRDSETIAKIKETYQQTIGIESKPINIAKLRNAVLRALGELDEVG